MNLDKQLNNALSLGDIDKIKNIFEKIFIEYKGLVTFIISRYIDSKENIDDLLFDVFLEFFNNANKVKTNIKGYLSTIAKNKTINFINKQKRIVNLEINELDYINYQSYEFTPRFNLLIDELQNHISKNELAIILDHLIEGLTFKEIGLKYNLNENNVKAKYFRALKKCNKEMKGEK